MAYAREPDELNRAVSLLFADIDTESVKREIRSLGYEPDDDSLRNLLERIEFADASTRFELTNLVSFAYPHEPYRDIIAPFLQRAKAAYAAHDIPETVTRSRRGRINSTVENVTALLRVEDWHFELVARGVVLGTESCFCFVYARSLPAPYNIRQILNADVVKAISRHLVTRWDAGFGFRDIKQAVLALARESAGSR